MHVLSIHVNTYVGMDESIDTYMYVRTYVDLNTCGSEGRENEVYT